ncbi:ribosomal RNA small subunit methyltransferase NEP1-like isoform X5 [Primulina tabacum]|uniref:ribosomal RNA small subunit methyltransferase NEP1-like isoform X5 n=1 Tax=Primulina tabacum TaxID=48773 RepID=UPI003F5A61E9
MLSLQVGEGYQLYQQKLGKMEGLRPCSKKRQREEASHDEERGPLTPQIPVEFVSQKPKVSFILDNAGIKKAFIRKVLKAILDSPLNKYGLVGAIYVKIANGSLFVVKPHVRIPRTLARFSGLMLELLEKSRIHTSDTHETLMRVIEEPLIRHLPANSRIVGISTRSPKLVDVASFVNATSDETHLVFVFGMSTSGEISQPHTADVISVTDYPVDAATCIDMICGACEEKWNCF